MAGLKGTYLRVESKDTYSSRYRPVSGLQYIKYTFTDPNGTVLRSESATFSEQCKEGYKEWTLYENIIDQIKLKQADLEIEVKDWAGHIVNKNIDASQIEIEEEDDTAKAKFANSWFLSFLKDLFEGSKLFRLFQ